MSEYLLEVYLSRASAGSLRPSPEDVCKAADHLSREGKHIHLLQTVFIPDDEMCLYLFQAQSAEVVVEVAGRCGLRFERLVEAESAWTAATPARHLARPKENQ